MTHYISVSSYYGKTCNKFQKASLRDAMRLLCTEEYASETKENSRLLGFGYKDTSFEYRRAEDEFQYFDCIFIDCDNDEENPLIIEQFKSEYKDYCFMLYETFSSTEIKPKFRALIPLDKRMTWSNNVKKAVSKVFRKYQDEAAVWFFSPTKNKLSTIYVNDGKLFPSKKISDEIRLLDQIEYNDFLKRFSNKIKYTNTNLEKNWRTIPKVKEYLEASFGTRNTKAYSAVCSMLRLDFSESDILDMLLSGTLDKKECEQILKSAKQRCKNS